MASVRFARSLALTHLLGFGLLVACAGSPPAPVATATAPVPAPAPAPVTTPPADVAEPAPVAATAPSADSAPSDERDGLRKASRPPLDLLTGNNVVYMFNFAGSAAGISAKQQCDAGGDPRAARECLDKARAKLAVESVRFVKDQSGQYWWVTYNRYKGNLLKWHKVQFAPGKEDADTISLNLIGKDKGIAPMARVPAKLKIELPNDYSIVISDPEHGEMLYDAKIGLMDNE